uniref:Smr domain-containing protein n=1 Tax=Caenorhabditis tropicalis TaxID=1561998 RepID=A0A1I7UID3_9PELO
MVVKWNVYFIRNPSSLDLHWMTPGGAIQFVEQMIEGRRGVFKLIVEKGNHSKNKMAAIKKELLSRYRTTRRCSIKEKDGNGGVLVLDLW